MTSKYQELAEEMATAIGPDAFYGQGGRALYIQSKLKQIAREALEEAAVIAETEADDWEMAPERACNSIAKAIRSKKEEI